MASDSDKITTIYNWIQANGGFVAQLSSMSSALSRLETGQSHLSTNIAGVKDVLGNKSDANDYGRDGSLSLVAQVAAAHKALVEKPLSVDLNYSGPTITEIADEFAKRGDTMVSQMKDLSEKLQSKSDETKSSVEKSLQEAATNYESKLASFSGGIQQQINYLKTIEAQVETTRSAVTAAVSDLTKVCTNLQTATASIVSLAPTVVADKQKIGETLLTVEGLTSEVAGITDLLSDFKTQVGAFANLLAYQQNSTETLAHAIETTHGVLADSLAERDRHNVVTEAFGAMQTAVTTALNESTKSNTANAQAMTESVEKALDITSDVVTQSLGSVKDSVNSCFDNVKDNMRSCFDNVTASLRSVATEQTKRVDTIAQTYSQVEKQRSKDGNISLAVDTALRTPEMLESIKRLVKKEVDL